MDELLNSTSSAQHPTKRAGHHMSHAMHLGHCLDYIRQAIMCTGDMTLEKAALHKSVEDPDGPEVIGVRGWGTAHECKSWEAIYDFTRQHRASEYKNVIS